MTACPGDEAIQALVEGRLSPADALALHRHLAICAACRDLLAALAPPLTAADSQASAAASPPLGQVIAGYRLVRRLGGGGMGEVFEANRDDIERRVAIKLIRPSAAEPTTDQARLLTEARAANCIAHPGILQVFEVGPLPQGGAYIVMEYLVGRTLGDRLAAGHWADALPLLSQIADAMAAAHAAGVVHRDLKPDNVMLVRDPLVPGGERVKVLDFGLARLARDEGTRRPRTQSGVVMGTPLYMSPEQCRSAARADARADVYSLGIMLYEVLAGRVPFTGGSVGEVIAAHLRDEPPPLRQVAPHAPPPLAELVARMLDKDPDRRPAMSEVARLLAPGPMGTTARARPRALGRRRFLSAGVLLAALAGAGSLGLYRGLSPRAVHAKERRTVAVLGFKSLSGQADVAWLSTALSELIAAELTAGEELRLIPGESVAQMRAELQLPDADMYVPETLSRVRQNLDVDLVATGSYLALGDRAAGQLRILVRLQYTHGGAVLTQVSITGTQGELLEVVARTGAALRQRLGLGELTPAAAQALRASHPERPAVARPYAEGLERLRRFDAMGARERLEDAIRADPDFPLAHAALAEAWTQLGYPDRARQAIQRAAERSAGLPREERLRIEARRLQATGQPQQAIEIFRSLVLLQPDDLELGLGLVAAQTLADEPRAAYQTALGLRRLPDPGGQDPRIDLAEAHAAYLFSDLRASREAAARAIARGEERGAKLLVARALRLTAWATFNAGEFPAAQQAAERSRLLFAAVGDRSGEADALAAAGAAQLWLGEINAGVASHEEAVRLYREVGNRYELSVQAANAGNAICQTGRLREARARAEEGLALGREIGRREALIESHVVLGWVDGLEGRLAAAKGHLEDALRAASGLGDRMLAAWALWHLGELHLRAGRVKEALAAHEDALRQRREQGLQDFAAESEVALALLHLGQGRAAEAVTLARRARARFVESRGTPNQVWAEAALAAALLGQGKRDEALQTLGPLRLQPGPQRLINAALAARVRAAAGPSGRAAVRGLLTEALREAREAGNVYAELELRLVQAQNAAAEGDPRPLKDLAQEAGRRGFALIERQALAR